MNYIVQNVISSVVYYIVQLIILISPTNALVIIPTLLTAIQQLGDPSEETLLFVVLRLVGVLGEPIPQVFPARILDLQIDGINLLQFLISSIPPGINIAPFSLVANLLGDYLTQLLYLCTT